MTPYSTLRTRNCALLLSVLFAFSLLPTSLMAEPAATAATVTTNVTLKYKVISGYKDTFNDDFQSYLAKGWHPVGGISVTIWNNNVYFAQLLAKPAN